MSTMNILSVTLIVLILAAGVALFFGIRSAQANAHVAPVFHSAPVMSSHSAADTMDEVVAPVPVE